MSLARFNKEFDKATSVSIKGSEKAIKEATKKLFGKIIIDTPVKTGQLRGNWQTTLKTPSTEVLLGTTDISGTATVTKSDNIISGLVFKGNNEIEIFMSNNLDYAGRIEFGQYSNQAPYGMVRVNVTAFKAEIDKAASKFKV